VREGAVRQGSGIAERPYRIEALFGEGTSNHHVTTVDPKH
jgi:hypothetical protein